jgi:hypothetical protein
MCVQSATIIQLESAHIGSGEPQRLLQFQPRLSLNLVVRMVADNVLIPIICLQVLRALCLIDSSFETGSRSEYE